MNRILRAKTGRDLRRRLPQFVAIAVTVLLGVLLFTASSDAYRNLSASYDRTYTRLHFADLTATGGDPNKIASAARGMAGVAGVATRTQADLPMSIGGDKLQGRVVGLPPHGQPDVNAVDIVSGSGLDPGLPGGALVERHAAKTFHLAPGDTVKVFDGSTWRPVTVRGVADSPEYLWPARNRQDVLGDPHSFAVLFTPETTARELTGATGPNQTLVELSAGARGGEAETRVAQRLRVAGAVDVQPRADQPSQATLREDINGFSELAVTFPALFLAAAAVAAYVLITRMVLAERKVIGTLLAAGARRGRLVRHYLGHGILTGAVGAVAGVALGTVATSAVTRAYTAALDAPDTVIRHRLDTAVIGLVFGVLVGVVSALAPALAAARTAPAEAMRGDSTTLAPPGRFGRALARARWLPVTWRLALRDLTRSRRRTVATMTGTVLSLVLVLTSVGMITSMRSMVDMQFGQVQQQDATVVAGSHTRGLGRALNSTPGVAKVEPVTTVQVTAASAGHSYTTSLTGYQPGTTMHRFRTTGGHWRELPDRGVLAGAALADRLHIKVGDPITVTTPQGTPRQVRLAGLLNEPLGTALYATQDTVRAATGASPNGYLLGFSGGTGQPERDRVRADVTALAGVVAYTDEQALRDRLDQYLGLFWIFIGGMLLLGGVLAFTVIYVTMTVNVAERTSELATLRAAGVRLGRVASLLAAENLTATVLAIPLGLVAGAGTAWAFLKSFSNDMFTMDLTLGWPALLLAAVAVLAAAALSQVPAVRAVRRIDIARVVRERAQ